MNRAVPLDDHQGTDGPATDDPPPLPLPGATTDPKPATPASPNTPSKPSGDWFDQYISQITEPPKPEPAPAKDLPSLLLPSTDDPVVAPHAEPAKPAPGSPPKPGGPAKPTATPGPVTGPNQATPPNSESPWFDTYINQIVNAPPPPKPEPRPEVPDGLSPYEFDKGITGPLLGPLYSPGQVEGARQRLDQPNGDLESRISELNDQYDDANFIGPKTPVQQQQLDQIGDERTLRETQLALYANGHCDYNCDVDAPYENTGSLDDPFDAAADELPKDATRAQVVAKAQEMAVQQQKEAAEQPKEDEGISPGHTALDVAGLAGPVGPFADGANAIWYGFEGDWGNAGFSAFGAIPIVGDIAKGGKLVKTGVKAAEAVNDVDNAIDATKLATRDPKDLAKTFADDNLGGKFDGGDGSDDALAGIFGKTASGSPVNAVRPGQFLPSQTRGYATELRALNELAARTDVKSIKAIPSAPGGRTPDFLVTRVADDGTEVVERVEVTTVTGAGTGYKPRGIGIADAPSKDQIKSALRRKTEASSQFNSQIDGVDEGGSLVIGLRGGKDAGAEAGNAISDMTKRLSDAKVREVTFTLGNGQTQRYVLENGAYALK